ncbi:MAG: DUF1232 domain-containing protein [Saprospiraceae bacterium]
MLKILKTVQFLQQKFKILGTRLAYSVLLMIYAYQSEKTPSWAKKIIIGAIAYLLSPFDGMPDLTPVIGFTDDLGVISFGLVAIACYIDEDVRTKAREKIHKLLKDIDDKELEAVDAKL